MPAPKGNQFWKLADPECLGRPCIFDSPETLWKQAKEYFQECDENPLLRTEVTTTDKGVFDKVYSHKIPYTWEGLYVFLGIENLDRYKKKEDFVGILSHIGNIIRNQKYVGAATGIFNANIIARDLGLRDHSDHTTNGESLNMTKEERRAKIQELLIKAGKVSDKENDSDGSESG